MADKRFLKAYYIILLIIGIQGILSAIIYGQNVPNINVWFVFWTVLSWILGTGGFVLSIIGLVNFNKQKLPAETLVGPIAFLSVNVIAFILGFVWGVKQALNTMGGETTIPTTTPIGIFLISLIAAVFFVIYSFYILKKNKK